MLGRTPGTISAIRPLKDGVIADFDVTEEMLRHFIQKVHQNRWAHPRVVVCVPSGVTGVEKRAVEEACLSAGARQAYLIEEPMAAAIGAGLPVGEPTGLDGRRHRRRHERGRGDLARRHRRLAVDPRRRRRARRGDHQLRQARVQAAHRPADGRGGQARDRLGLPDGGGGPGRDPRPRHGLAACPRRSSSRARRSARRSRSRSSQIIDAVKETLDRTPPELASDIMDRGIMLAGGGSLLQGLDERLREETQMPAHLAESPLTCVAVGSGRSLEEFEVIHRTNKNSTEPPPALLALSARARRLARSSFRSHVSTCTTRRSAGAGQSSRCSSPCSLILLTAYFGESAGGGLHSVQRGVLEVVSPIQEGASRALKPVRDLVRLVRRHARRQGRASTTLRKQSATQLRAAARSPAPTAVRENRQLAGPARARPERRRSQGRSPVTARVIGQSPTLWYSTITIDKGSSRGVRVGQPVITGDGLVGQVTDASRRSSAVVTLITDSDVAVVGARQRERRRRASSRPRAGGPNDLRLEYLRRSDRVDEGQTRRHRRHDVGVGPARVALPAGHPDRRGHAASTTPGTDAQEGTCARSPTCAGSSSCRS